MKKKLLIAAVCLHLSASAAYGAVVYCTNCSTTFTQNLDRVTNLSQLEQLVSQVTESVQQTQQQIQMVQHAIQNTMRLPDTLRGGLNGQLSQLANLTNQLNTSRGDYAALAQVFNNLFPAQSVFSELSAAATPEQIEAANLQYRNYQNDWSRQVDTATQATYQLSGRQLQDLSNAGGLENYIGQLLSTPDGQMKAMQAGNQLAAIQIQEARQMRELMATSAQQQALAEADRKKREELEREQWRQSLRTDMLDAPNHLNDPLPFRR